MATRKGKVYEMNSSKTEYPCSFNRMLQFLSRLSMFDSYKMATTCHYVELLGRNEIAALVIKDVIKNQNLSKKSKCPHERQKNKAE